MPIRKLKEQDIKQWQKFVCHSPEHNVPSMMVFEPGTYEHSCPACGKTVTFTVQGNSLMSDFPKNCKAIW